MDKNLVKGSGLVTLGFFFMAVFGIFTKAAFVVGSGIWISVLTYFVGTILMVPFVKGVGLRTEHFGFHFCRAAFGCAASFMYMLSMQDIPLVNATLLFNTAPLFLPILAIVFGKEVVGKKVWLAVMLGFVGIVVIIKPTDAIFGQAGDLIGLASGVSLAVAYFMIKLLSRTDPSVRIIFYYFFISLILQLPLLFFAGDFPGMREVMFAGLAGVALVLAQLFLVEGYKYASVAKVGVFQYTTIVFVGILDWIIWGVVPTGSDFIGLGLVILAAYFIIHGSVAQKTSS